MNIFWEEYNFEMKFLEGSMSALCIENVEAFQKIYEILWNLSQGEQGGISIYEKERLLKTDKDYLIIFNPYNISLNEKKMISRLFQEMKEYADGFFWQEKINLNSYLVSFIDKIVEIEPYPINYSFDFDCVQLFKMFDVKFDEQGTNLLERLCNYIKLVHQVLGIELFVFLNLRIMLNEEDELLIKEMVGYEKTSILMIDAVDIGKRQLDNYSIIDKDGCIITL